MKEWFEIGLRAKINRWKNVVRVLEGLTPHQRRKHWNMGVWLETTSCGTVGCAAGFCGMDPWFRRQGFKMSPGYGPDEEWTSPDAFFGYAGTGRIFYNDKKRPVSAVIKEVKSHIELLKEGKDGDF